MIDVIELALFYVAAFGAFYGVGGFISELLDRAGIWLMTPQKPCSEIDSKAFYKPDRYRTT